MRSPFSDGWLIKNSLTLFFAGAFVQSLQFLLNLFLSNRLGPELFGSLRTVLYLFTFLPAIIEFGTGLTLTRYIAEFNLTDKSKIGYLLIWFVKLRMVSFAVLIATIFALREHIIFYFLKDMSLNYLIIPCLFLTASSFFTILNQIVLGYQNFKLYSVAQILNVAFLFIAAVLVANQGIYYILFAWPLSNLSLIAYWKFLSKKNILTKIKEFDVKKIFWSFSIPMYLISIPNALQSFIVPFLSLFFSKLAIGYFSFAFIFYYAFSLIHGSLASVLFPRVSELNGLRKFLHARSVLKDCLKVYTFIFIFGLIGILLFSEQFISIIDKRYLPGLLMFQVLLSLGLIFGYANIYVAYLRGLGKMKRIAFLTLLQSFILIIVSFLVLL